jgi:hypothetical protein
MPVKFILHTSVSVNHPEGSDTRRGWFEKALIWLIRQLIPPSQDNQQATNFLHREIGKADPFVEWVTVRPDTLLEGGITRYTLHEELVNSLFAPGHTNMANIAHFMSELVTDPKAWAQWKGKLSVIVNGTAMRSATQRRDSSDSLSRTERAPLPDRPEVTRTSS